LETRVGEKEEKYEKGAQGKGDPYKDEGARERSNNTL
jgi:hypothetical protein